MVSATVIQILSETFVLKVNGAEYHISEHDEQFNELIGAKKGDVVLVKIKGGKIIQVQR